MIDGRRLPLAAALAGGACLLALGIGIGIGLWLRAPGNADVQTSRAAEMAPAAETSPAAHDHAAMVQEEPAHDHEAMMAAAGSAADLEVALSPEMASRAGLRTIHAAAGMSSPELRLPGVVQPNTYRQVAVTSLVSGRITDVRGELGMQVAAQEPLVTVYSPELAEAQTALIAARAEQVAHGQRQTRMQRLTAIGAASREELETLEAERAMHDSAVEVARARLALLGISEEQTQRLTGPQDVVTTIPVRAPFPGVITQRSASVGLNIDPSTPLFTIVDLSTVWVVADLYERDFARVQVGAPAAITSPAYPGTSIRGKVSYIDPQVQQDTRTAKLRVEVPNPGLRLRLGMFVDVQLGAASMQHGVLVPKTAVQMIGADAVVYLAADAAAGRFLERKVQVGETMGPQVLVVSGLQPGDEVVSEGAFFLRAERERRAQ